jgi:hypothetical protein
MSEREVYYYEYCPYCVHKDKAEDEDPCYECLDNPVNIDSRKPMRFEDDRSSLHHVGKTTRHGKVQQ